jgi:cell fate regulator YaaT (PSP1 superfamily)
MARSIDVTMFKKFEKLKRTYTPVMVSITNLDIASVPKTDDDPLGYRDYIRRKFKEKKLEVVRFAHDYKNNQLGLVFLASDSVVNPGFEVWGLVGYNVRGIE